MPARLSELAAQLAAACGLRLRAQAAILNLYHGGSSMCGHRDDAEPCQSAPIVSISLGMDAVYLLGRESRDVPPVAIRLRAGDVVVQGGASRAYVPVQLADWIKQALKQLQTHLTPKTTNNNQTCRQSPQTNSHFQQHSTTFLEDAIIDLVFQKKKRA